MTILDHAAACQRRQLVNRPWKEREMDQPTRDRRRAADEARLQEQAFQAHDATIRAQRARLAAMSPEEIAAEAHKRVVQRGRDLHARGLPHNCLCHERV